MTRTATATPWGIQLCLFSGMVAAVELQVERIEPLIAAQVSEEDDDEWVRRPIQQRIVSASECAPLNIKAPSSIFDAGSFASFKLCGGRKLAAGKVTAHIEIDRGQIGVTRVTRSHHTEAEEWQEKERQRRARQSPPRPPRQAFKVSGSRAWAEQQA